MSKRTAYVVPIACIVFVLALLTAVTWISVSVWQECRETNSFFYCLRLISR